MREILGDASAILIIWGLFYGTVWLILYLGGELDDHPPTENQHEDK